MKEIMLNDYEYIGSFCDGIAFVRKDNKMSFINKKGELLFPMKYYCRHPENEKLFTSVPWLSDGLIDVIDENGKFGYIDKNGEIKIPFQFENAFDFREGLARVVKDGKYGFIDINGNIVIPYLFENATSLCDGYINVMQNGKWGIINKNCETVVKCEYDCPFVIKDGVAVVQKRGIQGIIVFDIGVEVK